MREMIVGGFEQAYGSLARMIAEFLPRLLALLIAFVMKYLLQAALHFTRIDRISEQSGASQVLRRAALPSITELLTRSLFWVTWLGFTLVGISVLGIPELHDQISHLFQ